MISLKVEGHPNELITFPEDMIQVSGSVLERYPTSMPATGTYRVESITSFGVRYTSLSFPYYSYAAYSEFTNLSAIKRKRDNIINEILT
jgi:hypothetical protein